MCSGERNSILIKSRDSNSDSHRVGTVCPRTSFKKTHDTVQRDRALVPKHFAHRIRDMILV